MLYASGYRASPIKKLLDQLEGKEVEEPYDEPVTLRYFLDEEDLGPELRASNERLIEYLSQESILQELIHYSLNKADIPDDADEDLVMKLRFKYPNVASEVLAAEIPKITECVVSNPTLMENIYDLLDQDGAIDPIQAHGFSKLLVSFLRTKNVETLESIAARPNFMIGILKNANAAPIADMIVRILDNPDAERPFSRIVEPPRSEAIRLLQDADLLEALGNVFTATMSEERSISQEDERMRHEKVENISAVIVGLTRRVLQLEQNHSAMPDGLNIFKNPQTFGTILDSALEGDFNDPIVRLGLFYALDVAIELLTTELNLCSRFRPKNEAEQTDMNSMIMAMSSKMSRQQSMGSSPLTSPKSTSSTNKDQLMSTYRLEREMRRRTPRLLAVLQSGPRSSPLETTAGVVQEPLGSLKLKLVEFFVAALKSGGEDLQNTLRQHDVPNLLLDMFFSYEWGSILHQVIASAILFALDPEECTDVNSQKMWLKTYLVQKLMATYDEYREKKTSDDRHRNGFMGYVVQIALKVEDFLKSFDHRPNRIQFLREDVLDQFEVFCDDYLAEEKQRINTQLGGERPGNSNRTASDTDNGPEEAAEVFDMVEVMDELASGDNDYTMSNK